MVLEIKNRIEKELKNYLCHIDRVYSLSKPSPILYRNIREFILRKGKRLRPILFIVAYLGFTKKIAPGLYRSALSLELLHDFLLVHDDIIDKSSMRRSKPSLHLIMNRYLSNKKNLKFNGQDLSIVMGDVMFTLAIHSFLSIQEDQERKEKSLKKLIEAALYTESGEFSELLYSIKNIDKITREDIYKIYDYKTAHYTFASPLAVGAILAGADQSQINKLFKYGRYLGSAFQIKDDILGMFGSEKKIGKSSFTDLKEAKKTILIWHAYHHSNAKNKLTIKKIFSKREIDKADLLKMRRIISDTGTLAYAAKEIDTRIKKAESLLKTLKMQPKYKKILNIYTKKILDL